MSGAVVGDVSMKPEGHSWKVPTLVGAVIVALGVAIAVILNVLGPAEGENETTATQVPPATVEQVEGSDIARVTLTEEAAERLDIQTAATQSAPSAGEPLLFERAEISIESIDGDRVLLLEGPPAGTPVVVVGAAELFGAEFGVGH